MKTSAQHIIVVCNELPYPPNHGGRLDIWNHIVALAGRGCKICLICWYGNDSDLPNESTKAEIREFVEDLVMLPVYKGPGGWVKRLFLLSKYPWFVSALLLKEPLLETLSRKLSAFNPDLIFLVSIYGGDLAGKLSRKLKVPLVVRSQNIEHLYQQTLASQAITIREKLKLSLSLIGLERYEQMVISSSDWYFDISLDDLDYWKSRGIRNAEWLPTFINISQLPEPATSSPQWDVVYLGNLHSPNNVQGVIWFCEQVVPMLRLSQPDVRILIAGSNPVAQVQDICLKSQIALSPNPSSAAEIFSSGKVLINIAPKGSGVSTKSIEMLLFGVPIITTPQGVKGLPESIQQYFRIVNTAEDFSRRIIEALTIRQEENISITPFELLNRYFGDEAISCFEERLSNVVTEYNKQN